MVYTTVTNRFCFQVKRKLYKEYVESVRRLVKKVFPTITEAENVASVNLYMWLCLTTNLLVERNIVQLKSEMIKRFPIPHLSYLVTLAVLFTKSDLMAQLILQCSCEVRNSKGYILLLLADMMTQLQKNPGVNRLSLIVQTLLDIGARSDTRNDSGKTIVDKYSRGSLRKLFRSLLDNLVLFAKLKADPTTDLNEEVCGWTDHLACKFLKEREILSSVKVTDGFSLADIFEQEKKPAYLLDEELVAKLEQKLEEDMPKLKEKFPICAPILLDVSQLSKSSRYFLMNSAVASFSSAVRKEEYQTLPHVVRFEIMKYLSNEDLEKFVDSGKDN